MVRRKQRYILFHIKTDDGSLLDLKKEDIIHQFNHPFREMFGDFGAGCAIPTLNVIVWLEDRGIGVLRIVREWAEGYKQMLEEVKVINETPVTISVPHISGTVDQAQRWIADNPTAFE